jgi:outer membrane autotransporter protein
LGPMAQLGYVYLDQGDFNESGADHLNLRLAGFDQGYLYSRLGLNLAALLRTGPVLWLPRLSLAWQHNFDPDREITASFRDYESAPFSADYAGDEDGLALSAALNLRFSQRFGAFVSYHLQWSDNWQGHMGALGLQFSF